MRIAITNGQGEEIESVTEQQFMLSTYALFDIKRALEMSVNDKFIPSEAAAQFCKNELLTIFCASVDEDGKAIYQNGDENRVRQAVEYELGDMKIFRVNFEGTHSIAQVIRFILDQLDEVPAYIFVNGKEMLNSFVGVVLDDNGNHVFSQSA